MKKTILLFLAGLLINLPINAQWTEDYSVNNKVTPHGKETYGSHLKTNKNGVSFLFMEQPGKGTIQMRLQIIDKDGQKVFPDSCYLISAEPNISYVLVGDKVFIDNDNNAVIAVQDQRTGKHSYTLYKFNEKGEKLWDGIQLNDAKPMRLAANIKMCQTSDKGYIVAYEQNEKSEFTTTTFIKIEKFDINGKKLWKEPLMIGGAEGSEPCSNPYIFDAGINQSIIVYSKGMSKSIYARLIDFDGSSAWDDDVIVYKGGDFGSIPIHEMMNVKAGPDKGVILTWSAGNRTYENKISYIKNDGSYAFSTGELGTVICNNSDISRRPADFFFDDKEQAIYCIFGVFDQGRQSYNGLYMQKISYDGELIWGPDGMPIFDLQKEDRYGYGNIRKVDDNTFAVLYQKKLGNDGAGSVESNLRLYNKDGEQITNDFNFTTSEFEKSALKVSELIDGTYFLTNWRENRFDAAPDTPKQDMMYMHSTFMQKLNVKDILTGIDDVKAEGINGKAVSTEIYNIAGKKVSTMEEGVNIVRTTYENGVVKTNKVIK